MMAVLQPKHVVFLDGNKHHCIITHNGMARIKFLASENLLASQEGLCSIVCVCVCVLFNQSAQTIGIWSLG